MSMLKTIERARLYGKKNATVIVLNDSSSSVLQKSMPSVSRKFFDGGRKSISSTSHLTGNDSYSERQFSSLARLPAY